MVNPEEVLQSLDEFSKLKPKDIPRELEEYLMYVAKTGDPVYQWSLVKCLFREKMLNVITDFYESCPTIDMPPCPNVDPFNYETMKASLIERLESFSNAPFTVQRLCELLTTPRKEYTRVDKFMRAIEKNILVVSTKEPGGSRLRNDSQQQSDVLMNGVIEGRGLDIGEAIETVSAEGVNLMQGSDAVSEGADESLADSIRVECEDIEMDDGTTASSVVWDTKVAVCGVSAEGIKALSSPSESSLASSGSVVWDTKPEESTINGEGLKVLDSSEANGTIIWDTKDSESAEGLKNVSPTPDTVQASGDASTITKTPVDESDTASVVVSEIIDTTPEDGFSNETVEIGDVGDSVAVVLTRVGPTPAGNINLDQNVESTDQDRTSKITETNKIEKQIQEAQTESDSKDLSEHKDSECEDTSQVDAESGISCSADSSVSSDCATAEMNQTLETNGSLEITSVESEVMSPLQLEDVSPPSPPSPDTGSTLDAGEITPPPTFAEMTADEDTQDAPRCSDPLDDDANESQGDTRLDTGTKSDSTLESVSSLETKMDVDDDSHGIGNIRSREADVEQRILQVPVEDTQLEMSSQNKNTAQAGDSTLMSYDDDD